MRTHRFLLLFAFVVVTLVAVDAARAGVQVIAQAGDPKTVYVTQTTALTITLFNLGTNDVTVSRVTSTDADATGGFITLITPLPIRLRPTDSAVVQFRFAPNAADIVSGERAYGATFAFDFGSASPITARINGWGVIVRASATALRTPRDTMGRPISMPITISSWSDPMGTVDARGFTVAVSHYRRGVVAPDTNFNLGGTGQTGTKSAGGVATVSAFNANAGSYALTVANCIAPIVGTGSLINLQFLGIMGSDTSIVNYAVTSFTDAAGNPLPFVIVSTSSGLLTVDSLKKQDTTHTMVMERSGMPCAGMRLEQNTPNPFMGSTQIHVTLEHATTARIAVYDALGREVRRLSEGTMSAGEHELQFTAGSLPTGEYRVAVLTPQGIMDKRMVLIR
jgi:hypothetical protein